MINYTNQAVRLKLLDDVERFYLSTEEQETLIFMRIESSSLDNLLVSEVIQ